MNPIENKATKRPLSSKDGKRNSPFTFLYGKMINNKGKKKLICYISPSLRDWEERREGTQDLKSTHEIWGGD